ncbi:MAG: class I SAM-dependent methyltransferase [Anaerolineales bacterium]
MKTLFTDIPKPILDRMAVLEERDARDRQDGTSNLKRLRQVPPETGMLLALLAAAAPRGQLLEIGTSAGYSSMWLSLACKQRGDKLVTFELLHDKADLARETFAKAKVEEYIELVNGDARSHLKDYDELAFCFLDCEKEMYAEIYPLVVPRLLPGGLLVADNVISHQDDLAAFLDTARQDKSVDAAVLPVGLGLLVCTKLES